jgi:hypothetical protein
MPIRVECDCGRAMTVRDELAGKLVKCPECKETLRVPADDDEDEAPRRRSQAVRRRRDEEDDYEDDRPARRRRAAGRYDDEDDYDEDDYDRPRRRRERKEPVSGVLVTMLSIGIGALVLLALSTIPRAYTMTYSMSASSSNKDIQKNLETTKKVIDEESSKADWPGFISTWRGIVILLFALLLAGLVTTSLILLYVAGRTFSNVFLLVTSAVVAGWGVLTLLWFLGYVFKGFTMGESKTQPVPEQLGGGTLKASVTVLPGWGLLLGVLMAGTILTIFCILVFKRGALWGLLGLGVGALAGLLLMTFDARFWENPRKAAEKAREEAQKQGRPPPKEEQPWFAPKLRGGGGLHIRNNPTPRPDSAVAARHPRFRDSDPPRAFAPTALQRTSSKAKRLLILFAGQGLPSTSTYG